MSTRARPRRGAPGVTLLEIMVASAILSMIGLMIFAAFDHTSRARKRLGARQERDHGARVALARISRDIRAAFLSAHVNTNPTFTASLTAFAGRDEGTYDRLDLTTFTHRRIMHNAHEGDACEVGYRVEGRATSSNVHDLLRRESPRIDNEPTRGGTVDVLVPDIDSFELRYYDGTTDRWLDAWDTTQAAGQPGRLPARVRITLTMRENDQVLRYRTETAPMITEVLRFGLPIDFH